MKCSVFSPLQAFCQRFSPWLNIDSGLGLVGEDGPGAGDDGCDSAAGERGVTTGVNLFFMLWRHRCKGKRKKKL